MRNFPDARWDGHQDCTVSLSPIRSPSSGRVRYLRGSLLIDCPRKLSNPIDPIKLTMQVVPEVGGWRKDGEAMIYLHALPWRASSKSLPLTAERNWTELPTGQTMSFPAEGSSSLVITPRCVDMGGELMWNLSIKRRQPMHSPLQCNNDSPPQPDSSQHSKQQQWREGYATQRARSPPV